jgi:two-component system, OmpR family, alkaline phosphatase synthesis response regulator PhoP
VFSIAVVSNQAELLRTVQSALAQSDYRVRTLPHGESSFDDLTQEPPYVLIFDHGDGGHLDEWRALGEQEVIRDHTALIALLQPEQPYLLEAQPAPDDFVLWPAGAGELLMRVRAILRRRANVDSENVLRCGDLLLDLANYKVMLEGRAVELTFKEYELLRFLASNPEKVFTREALLNRVWGYDYFGGARTVDVHIRRLRSKIEDRGHSFIETIRSVGYRFKQG